MKACSLLPILSLCLLFTTVSCVSIGQDFEVLPPPQGEGRGTVYVYMPKDVDSRGAEREGEGIYLNGRELGSLSPGMSIGFYQASGYFTLSTQGLFQEKLERRFFLNPGGELFIALEKGFNFRPSGYLIYTRSRDLALPVLDGTRFIPIDVEALQ